MPLIVDGVEITSVIMDGVALSQIIMDGVEVWKNTIGVYFLGSDASVTANSAGFSITISAPGTTYQLPVGEPITFYAEGPSYVDIQLEGDGVIVAMHGSYGYGTFIYTLMSNVVYRLVVYITDPV